jgi:RNA polymerase sigma-70 factor (ECF subfamily)
MQSDFRMTFSEGTRFVIAVTRTLPPGASLELIELNGAAAIVAKAAGGPLVVVMIETDGVHIHSIFAIANPDKLTALTPAPRLSPL